MKIYISGPMTGLPNLNFPKFEEAKQKMLALGYEVVSPHDLELARDLRAYKDKLRDDFKHLLECDSIYLLDGWEASYGARVEYVIARAVGMRVIKEV